MMPPLERVRAAARRLLGASPELLVQAPGRVNLIGDHTDYNDGFVLPCAIGFGTVIGARRRADGVLRAIAVDFDGAEDAFAPRGTIAHGPAHSWSDYIRGAVDTLVRHGHTIGGADLVIAGDVPQGAGLSSSASLLVAVVETLRRLNDLADLDPTAVAVLAREAEVAFVGVNCGIMDQLISARGVEGHALMIDCRTLAADPVPLGDAFAVLIVHSGVERGLVGSEYNARRVECEQVARFFGVTHLRDVDAPTLAAAEGALDPVAFRRARHVVTENDRVVATADALARADMTSIARLMAASHASLRGDFAVSVPKIDELVAILADALGARGGARMTGGGFGGCVVALMEAEAVADALAAVRSHYRTPTGAEAQTFVVSAVTGAGTL